ncbi:CHAT domain-containing protein [Lachnospiraceae bacterium 62-26]
MIDYNIPQYYKYIILFKGEIGDIEPILHVSDMSVLKSINSGRMHLFDESLTPIIPAIEYCLHMSRTEMDTYDTDTEVLDMAYDVPQEILIMPDIGLSQFPFPFQPTLIIYADDCLEEVKNKAKSLDAVLGTVSISDLSVNLLVKQWNILFDKRSLKNGEKLVDIDKQYLLEGEKQLLLPVLFTARQYGKADYVYNAVFNSMNVFETCANLIWNQLLHHNALMSCKGFGGDDSAAFKVMFSKGLEKAEKETRVNVVITMPGVPQGQINYGGLTTELPDDEKKVIKLLGIHRAIAKEALLIELPVAGKGLFEKLNELEINCKQGTNNKYVHKTLRDIGKVLEKKFTQEQMWAVNWAKHITIFSDFPIGLAIIGDSDTSLQCYKEMSYRTLSPLTRCVQNEMVKHQQLYYGNRCKIAFAECVLDDSQNRFIRSCSNSIVHSLKKLSKENGKMKVTYCETLTIKDLKKFISDNLDADILHISAHGYYNRRSNMAGLMVGNEFWMADENDYRVPPVVVLSACHISPRGSGTVNVADLFMRVGAEAVLGTFIPVGAKRNMILINRFYTYIAEAQKGSMQYKTLSEAWSGVVATNAIHEIAETSERFFKWIWGINSEGKLRMMDFTMRRSIGRLHGWTMYADTILIVKEMLHEEGLDGKYDDILNQENYFPESFFYQWIGFPENIFLLEK